LRLAARDLLYNVKKGFDTFVAKIKISPFEKAKGQKTIQFHILSKHILLDSNSGILTVIFNTAFFYVRNVRISVFNKFFIQFSSLNFQKFAIFSQAKFI
jgi:hypothetical protein